MANILLKYSLKTNIVKSIFFEVISKVSRYYYTFGRATPWETILDPTDPSVTLSDDENPPGISDTYSDELEVRRNMIYMKGIDSNDIGLVVRRINWIPGLVYDMYDDYDEDNVAFSGAQSISQANFYVISDEYNVYKCLYNNADSISMNVPSGTDAFAKEYADGYIWKYMYSIPISLRNKFLTTSYMPVTTSLTNQFYSAGSIIDYVIEARGSRYIKNTWSVKRIVILNGGNGYDINDIELNIPAAPSGGTSATAVVTEVGDNGQIVSISISEHGSGYLTQPVLQVASTQGTGFVYTVEYDFDSSAYTKLKIVGDGYNPNNPYTLKTVTVLDGGTFGSNYPTDTTGQVFLQFPSPQLETGHRPKAQFTFGLKNGSLTEYEIKYVTVVDEGYGYTEPLLIGANGNVAILEDLYNAGFRCDLNVSLQKNEAELIPLINDSGEIEEIIVSEAGIGYTYASVKAEAKKTVLMIPDDPNSKNLVDMSSNPDDFGYTEGFVSANIQLQFGVGDIDTKQSNVELLAVDGAIRVINVDYGGLGYNTNTTSVTVDGDGVGFLCETVIQGGVIKKINVINEGSGYTYANVKITPDYSVDENGNPVVNPNAARLRAIISPKGGHGKDSVSELYCNSLMLVTKLSIEKNKGIIPTNDYRQISILKNPKLYQQDTLYRNSTGSAATLFICDRGTNNDLSYAQFEKDDVLNFSLGNKIKTFILIDKAIINNKYYLLVQVNDNYIPPTGSTIFKRVANGTAAPISIVSIEYPDFNKYSGEMLYIDNRVRFAPSEDQTIIASTLLSF